MAPRLGGFLISGPIDEATIEIGDKDKTKRAPANDGEYA